MENKRYSEHETHSRQSPETELVNKWLNRRNTERTVISMLCVAAAAGIGLLIYKKAVGAVLPLILGVIAGMIIVLLVTLGIHEAVMLRRLQQSNPELWENGGRSPGFSPLENLEHYNKAQKKRAGCGGSMLLILCAAGVIGFSLFRDTLAAARVEELNRYAKMVCTIANTWQTQQEEAGNPTELYTVLVNYGEEYAKGSLEEALLTALKTESMYIRRGNDITRVPAGVAEGGCAILCDENGRILYTCWCDSPLSEEDLVPLDYDTQYEQERSFSGEGTVGWYTPS